MDPRHRPVLMNRLRDLARQYLGKPYTHLLWSEQLAELPPISLRSLELLWRERTVGKYYGRFRHLVDLQVLRQWPQLLGIREYSSHAFWEMTIQSARTLRTYMTELATAMYTNSDLYQVRLRSVQALAENISKRLSPLGNNSGSMRGKVFLEMNAISKNARTLLRLAGIAPSASRELTSIFHRYRAQILSSLAKLQWLARERATISQRSVTRYLMERQHGI